MPIPFMIGMGILFFTAEFKRSDLMKISKVIYQDHYRLLVFLIISKRCFYRCRKSCRRYDFQTYGKLPCLKREKRMGKGCSGWAASA